MSDVDLICSFCGKNQKEVKKLIAGRSDKDEQGKTNAVYICDHFLNITSE